MKLTLAVAAIVLSLVGLSIFAGTETSSELARKKRRGGQYYADKIVVPKPPRPDASGFLRRR